MQISLADRKGGRRSAKRAWPESPITAVEVPEYFQRKTVVMRLLGILLLIVFLPVMLVCLALVRLTSRGPAIYHQMRLGKDQRPFKLYKIRTMRADCETVSGPMLCQPRDSRVTPVGRVLRFLHLDELPQLINVARGEMCLVGPRPERPEIIERHKLKELVPGFEERTKVLPGVTGLAQINLPADLTAESVIPKVQLDLGYIETATAALDFRILLCTALRMSGGPSWTRRPVARLGPKYPPGWHPGNSFRWSPTIRTGFPGPPKARRLFQQCISGKEGCPAGGCRSRLVPGTRHQLGRNHRCAGWWTPSPAQVDGQQLGNVRRRFHP